MAAVETELAPPEADLSSHRDIARLSRDAHGIQGELAQGWLFPGDGGPGFATAILSSS